MPQGASGGGFLLLGDLLEDGNQRRHGRNQAVFTMGTRGDVQLYIYLAGQLIEEGIDTIIGTHPYWKDLVEEAGVGFVPIGSNINIEKEMAAIRGNGTNPMSGIREQEFVADFFQDATHDILNACKGKDMVIVGHTMIGAVEAEDS